jgi:lipoyl-dependent peroxiredoxin subunit D
VTVENTRTLAASIPETAKDLRLNLTSVLSDGSLSEAQRLGVGLACAYASRNARLVEALAADTVAHGEGWVDDAKAAAALMAMNNVYYRFRHKIGKPSYGSMPARLRMQRIAQALTSKLDFELMCLAVSAINDCEMCVQTHERSLLELGASEAQVHDAVRIAAAVHGAALALELDTAASASETP